MYAYNYAGVKSLLFDDTSYQSESQVVASLSVPSSILASLQVPARSALKLVLVRINWNRHPISAVQCSAVQRFNSDSTSC